MVDAALKNQIKKEKRKRTKASSMIDIIVDKRKHKLDNYNKWLLRDMHLSKI